MTFIIRALSVCYTGDTVFCPLVSAYLFFQVLVLDSSAVLK